MHGLIGDRLVVGKFCALAKGVKFIMNGANHKMSGFSTYPFQIFGNGWEKVIPGRASFPTGVIPSWETTCGSATTCSSCPASPSVMAQSSPRDR